MRQTFFETLEKQFQKDRNVYILTADLGYKLFDVFKKNCPNRFYNIGVAEANMIDIASGLSLSGKNVYCYSIIPFLLMRTFEQIRVGISHHNLNVKLVGAGGGVTYGLEGFTHFALEDLALMRTLPNMTIIVPSDPLEAKRVAEISLKYKGPMYIRLGKTGEPYIHKKIPDLKIGKALVLKEGKDIAIFAIGNMVYAGIQAANKLESRGIKTMLINMHTLKPLDVKIITQVASTHKIIFSLEEHNIEGGLGTAIAEVLAEIGYQGIFKRIGITAKIHKFVGKAEYLRKKCGLTPEKIHDNILKEIKKNE